MNRFYYQQGSAAAEGYVSVIITSGKACRKVAVNDFFHIFIPYQNSSFPSFESLCSLSNVKKKVSLLKEVNYCADLIINYYISIGVCVR
jgi:hypothetical protein